MGYERQKLQILGGGYSALPPADKVPATDYLLAQNFRSDALGRLISRAGYPSQFSIAGAGIAHSAASAGGVASPYYVGCNSDITAPVSKLYYNGNPTAIASGFDGKRIGFAAQNGFMWVMNRGNQGRHQPGGTFEPWNIAPPTASPTVAIGGSPSSSASGTFTFHFVGTTIAASVAVGSQTVTPASMTGIVLGMNLAIYDTAGGHYEVVVVTAVTGTTFDAVFTSIKVGPGISVSFADYLHYITVAGMQYSFAQGGYSDAEVAHVMALVASGDPNCTVSYPGTGNDVLVTAVVPFTLIVVSASDGNATMNLANGSVSSLPNGTYRLYLTFQSLDLSLESNPSPASDPIPVNGQNIAVTIPAADAPTDARVGFVNIYATGGTLGQPYRVGQVASTVASPATTFLDTISDGQATNNGIVMPTENDPAPAASGIIGPHFSRLYAWSTAANKNRLFWTPANQPQYFPGSADPQVGNWVDVGADDEEIVWCSVHVNLLVIYKERSIWVLLGADPGAAVLEQVYDGLGLVNAFALAPAGQIDYFIAPNGLCLFDMAQVHEISGNILPLFNQSVTHAGPLTPPGSVLPGTAFNSNSTSPYAIAMGHALGRLYIGYAEKGTSPLAGTGSGTNVAGNHFFNWESGDQFSTMLAGSPGTITINGVLFTVLAYISPIKIQISAAASAEVAFTADALSFNLLVFDEGPEPERQAFIAGEKKGRWFYHRHAVAGTVGFFGFFFDGTVMNGLTGAKAGAAQGLSLSDFRGFLTEDLGTAPIECVYGSHYEDAGQPDNDKQWLEVAIDYEYVSGADADVWVGFNAGKVAPLLVGSLTTGARKTLSFGFSALAGATQDGYLARSMAALIDVRVTGLLTIHNVFFFYYGEARLAVVASSIPTDLGIGKIKQCKELELDISTGSATVAVTVLTDLPGHAMAARQTPTVAIGGRSLFKYPFAVTQGLLWQVSLQGGPFRLYSARLLMRVPGVAIEGYETTAGYRWDSQEIALGNGEVSTLDQLRFEMETDGAASVELFTDEAGETSTSKGTYTLTAGAATRAWITVPLGAGIEGRSVRLQINGAGYRLYKAQVRHFRIGRFLVGTAPSGLDDQYRTLEFDLGSEHRSMFKRIEVNLRNDQDLTVTVSTDQDGAPMAPRLTAVIGHSSPSAHNVVLLVMPPGVRGRLLRIKLISTGAARIYGIRVWTRRVNDPAAAWKWLDMPLETSDVLSAWSDLIVEETSPTWQWVDVPMEVTG